MMEPLWKRQQRALQAEAAAGAPPVPPVLQPQPDDPPSPPQNVRLLRVEPIRPGQAKIVLAWDQARPRTGRILFGYFVQAASWGSAVVPTYEFEVTVHSSPDRECAFVVGSDILYTIRVAAIYYPDHEYAAWSTPLEVAT